MDCRQNCGAFCIAPSINSPIPDMPNGKPAGVRCIQLLDDFKCALFGKPQRPDFCGGLQPNLEKCGETQTYSITWLSNLERATMP